MPAPPPISRRAAVLGVVGAAGAVTLQGCTTDDLRPHDPAPTATAPTASPGQPTPDEQLVDGVATQILTALGTALAARRLPALHHPLGVVVHTHREHLAALHQDRKVPRVARPSDLLGAVNALVAAETTLQGQLVDAAVQAESGTLAVLLASMSASIGQLVLGPLALPVHP